VSDKQVPGWWFVAGILLSLVLALSLIMVSNAFNDTEAHIKRCLRIERDEAALRCVASEVGR